MQKATDSVPPHLSMSIFMLKNIEEGTGVLDIIGILRIVGAREQFSQSL